MRGIALRVAIGFLAVAVWGCSTVPPTAIKTVGQPAPAPETAAIYSGGRASKTFASTSSTVQPVVLAAMADLHIEKARRFNESGVTMVEGTTPDNRRVSVTLRTQNLGWTRLTARVGLFGDEVLSRLLLERVAIRLGELPPAAIPTEIPSAPTPNPFLNFARSVGNDSDLLRDLAESRFRDTPIP